MKGRFASIDIGTNTLRLLIAEVKDRFLIPVCHDRYIARLGGGYSEAEGMTPDAMERAVGGLRDFRSTIDGYAVERVRVVATSVVRMARNGMEFAERIRAELGFEVEVVSGEREAQLALLGVLAVLDAEARRCLVMDIGGGSTEFIAADGGKVAGAWSLEMGVVHLAESYLHGDPPAERELRAMELEVDNLLEVLKGLMYKDGVDVHLYRGGRAVFVGTAGTVTTLAAIEQKMERYRPELINNYTISRDRVIALYHSLSSMTLEKRSAIPALERGREDLILPGAAITRKAMDTFGFESMTVSDSGLLEGIIIDLLGVNTMRMKYSPSSAGLGVHRGAD